MAVTLARSLGTKLVIGFGFEPPRAAAIVRLADATDARFVVVQHGDD